ncbi:MAG: MBL fold metallo-hydrolase [Candidatus Wolfebacteria bacterium]|nr:MBL fold metallo-hydrolase [Candidatus Wolfebacteria bacterium]
MKGLSFAATIFFCLIILDTFIWGQIFFAGPAKNAEIYGLDVGQGDSELVVLPGNVKILIDGGPDNSILGNLSSVFGSADRYIDLVVMSHPQMDHFMGLIDVLKRYRIGAFIYNGQTGVAPSFKDLANAIQENKIPAVAVREGDKIISGENRLDILSPSLADLKNKDVNLGALVLELFSAGKKALFTADIDSGIEKKLVQKYDLDVDVLKVGHHGSKFSSSNEFLKAATPIISFIEVGAKNTYGHPTAEALKRITDAGSQIFRTDKNGLIKIDLTSAEIKVWDER